MEIFLFLYIWFLFNLIFSVFLDNITKDKQYNYNSLNIFLIFVIFGILCLPFYNFIRSYRIIKSLENKIFYYNFINKNFIYFSDIKYSKELLILKRRLVLERLKIRNFFKF